MADVTRSKGQRRREASAAAAEAAGTDYDPGNG